MRLKIDILNSLLIVILVLSMILVYFSTVSKKDSFFDRLLSKINAISVIYVAIGIYITFKIFNQNTGEMRRQNTLKIIDRSLLGNIKLITENYDKCPKFCSSLFYSWQKPTGNKEPEGEDEWPTVLMLSFNIFQAFEDILTVSDVDQTGLYVWIANFMPWCRSQYLKKAWEELYPNFGDRTILFTNLLFEYCYDNPEPIDAKEYKTKSHEFVDSTDFQKIFKS